MNSRSVGPRPADLRARAPCSENKNTSCFDRYMTVTSVMWCRRRTFVARGPPKVPISLKFEDESCVLAHLTESKTLPCIMPRKHHHELGSTLCYRPLHDSYDRYTLSCTRYVAILVGPPGPLGPHGWARFLNRSSFSSGPVSVLVQSRFSSGISHLLQNLEPQARQF